MFVLYSLQWLQTSFVFCFFLLICVSLSLFCVLLIFSAGLVKSSLLCFILFSFCFWWHFDLFWWGVLIIFCFCFFFFLCKNIWREMGLISRKLFPACESMCVCCPALRSSSRQPVKRYRKLLSEIFPKSLVSILFCFVDWMC